MRLEHDISQRQIQRIVMTPELRMSINILQMPSFELMDFIYQALTENPLLEEMPDSEAADRGGESRESIAAREGAEQFDRYEELGEELGKEEREWDGYFEEESGSYSYGNEVAGSHAEYGYSDVAPLDRGITLEEHLIFQLLLCCSNPEEREIGEYIIGNLDENGYLTCGVEEISKVFGLSARKVKRILSVIQGFEPIGVAARSLEESLLIQLDNCDIEDELYMAAKQIILGYIGDLAKGGIGRISSELGISSDLVQRAKDLIHSFDPKPGRSFSNQLLSSYIVPDIVVRKIDESYAIIPNDSILPRLTINPQVRASPPPP
jgi:RNA polymerase sigma-54 factor